MKFWTQKNQSQKKVFSQDIDYFGQGIQRYTSGVITIGFLFPWSRWFSRELYPKNNVVIPGVMAYSRNLLQVLKIQLPGIRITKTLELLTYSLELSLPTPGTYLELLPGIRNSLLILHFRGFIPEANRFFRNFFNHISWSQQHAWLLQQSVATYDFLQFVENINFSNFWDATKINLDFLFI